MRIQHLEWCEKMSMSYPHGGVAVDRMLIIQSQERSSGRRIVLNASVTL